MTPPPTHETPPSRLPKLPDSERVRDLYNSIVPVLVLLAMVGVVIALGWSWQNSAADHRQDQQRSADQAAAIADNEANAVTNCENANESRQGSRALWGYVLDLLAAGNPNPGPADVAFIGQFRTYVNAVYRAHDCEHLELKYPAPTPPVIPGS